VSEIKLFRIAGCKAQTLVQRIYEEA